MKKWLLVSLLLLLVLVPNATAFSNPTRNGDEVTLPPCSFPNGIYYQNGPNPGTPVAPVNQNYILTLNESTEGQYTCGPSGSGGQITLHRQFKENKTLVPKTFTWEQRQVLDCTGYVPGNFHSGYKVTWLLDGRQPCIKNSACEDNNFNINPDNFSLSFDYYPTFTTYECQIEPDVPGSSTNVTTVASYTLSPSHNDQTQTTFIENLKPVLVENGTNKVEFSCSASVKSNASINFNVSDLLGNEPISPADCNVTIYYPTIRSCSKTLHSMNVMIMCNYSTSYEIHCTFSWNLTNINESRVYSIACHVNDGTTEASTRTQLIVRGLFTTEVITRTQLILRDSSSVGSVSSSLESASFSLESSIIDSSSLDSSVTNPPSTETPQLSSSTLTIVAPVVLVLVLCVCIIIVFVIVIIVRRNRKKKLVDLDLRCVDDSRISLDLNSACQKVHHQKDKTSTDDTVMKQLLIKYLIPSSQIEIQETIGQGEFGIVYKATMKATNKSQQEIIALKTLKGAFSKSDVDSLLEECLLMSNFDNPNVLSLIGVCADLGSAPGIIMPYMSKGSLLSYLQKEKSHLIVGATSEESTVLNVRKQLLSVCLQVANGMNYLASQRFIHRDLATRNCLIADNGVIKVADFGLSEEIYTKNYFNQFKESKSVKLPVKWMALESLHYGIFSEKSDVWSYGILCWEVFSGGKIPYPGMDPIGLVELLDGGQRLSCPHNEACSEDIYSLMQQCWVESPDDRPLFSDLVGSVNALIMPLAPYLIVSNDSTFQLNHDHIYY